MASGRPQRGIIRAMYARIPVIAAILVCAWAPHGVGQGPSTAASQPSTERLRKIAVRWDMWGPPLMVRQEVEATLSALIQKQPGAAITRWRKFLGMQQAAAQPFDVEASLDYVLNRLAAERSQAADTAWRKLRFYNEQEDAVFEHITTVDKQLSAYSGADISGVLLREPWLADYGDGVEPVTRAPGTSVGVTGLRASLDRWNARLPEITAAREAAINAFVKAVNDDSSLAAEIQDVDVKLRSEIAKATANKN